VHKTFNTILAFPNLNRLISHKFLKEMHIEAVILLKITLFLTLIMCSQLQQRVDHSLPLLLKILLLQINVFKLL
jgi:hypothetical protein